MWPSARKNAKGEMRWSRASPPAGPPTEVAGWGVGVAGKGRRSENVEFWTEKCRYG